MLYSDVLRISPSYWNYNILFFFLFPQPVWSEWPSQWDPVRYMNFNFYFFFFFSIAGRVECGGFVWQDETLAWVQQAPVQTAMAPGGHLREVISRLRF